MKLSVIIPAHNEESQIGKTLDSYYNFWSSVSPAAFEIIIVLNDCRDNTLNVVTKFCKEHKEIKFLNFEEPIGKGRAICEGFKVAKGKFISFIDADGATVPKELLKLIKECQKGYDGVIGSRWMRESRVLVKQPLKRQVASRVFNLIVRFLFKMPYRDTQCGAKVFRNYVIRDIGEEIEINGFAFDVDLLWRGKQKGYQIKEVPVTWQDRYGSSIVLHRDAPRMLKAILSLWFKERIRNRAKFRGS